jgi:hypothetical protein
LGRAKIASGGSRFASISDSAKVNEKIHHEAGYALSGQGGLSNRFDPYVFGDDIAGPGSKLPQRTGLGASTGKSL